MALQSSCCTICQATFTSRNQLFDHLQIRHGYIRQEQTEEDWKYRTELERMTRAQFTNLHHDAYYRKQCKAGVMTINDWEQAKEYFLKPLNVAFRIQSSSSSSSSARYEMVKRIEQQCNFVSSPYFSSTTTKVAIRPLREWSSPKAVSDAQDVGAVNRQELSSMVPPLLLFSSNDTVKDTPSIRMTMMMSVLDLCAAPGSKSLQLLDLLPNNGMLVANDAHRTRTLTIPRRARLNANKKHCLIVNSSDGRHFPSLRKWGGYKFKFDGVLADVPCSGDGTLRKLSSSEWEKWSIPHHLSLHKLQLQLLIRSMELVKKGGRVVYSTCSLDPIENEAVVASAISRMGGPTVYRIVPPPQHLHKDANQTFVYSPGATSWFVPDPQFTADHPVVYTNLLEVPVELKRRISISMFPPRAKLEFLNRESTEMKRKDTMETDVAQLEAMLPNCCRILPQHLDSGGFFCAIIERIAPNFFAICYPKQRNLEGITKTHHGRVYQCNDMRTIQTLVMQDKKNGEEVYYEGWPTLEAAQQWLRQHSSYVEGRSGIVSVLPEVEETVERNSEKSQKEHYQQTPTYTPLFTQPDPDLVQEFLDLFGLLTSSDTATAAGVERFPVEQLVTTSGGGGGGGGVNDRRETSSIDLDPVIPLIRKKKQKTFHLTLVSESIRSLYAGGAKFNPMEVGLSLCSIPVVEEDCFGQERYAKGRFLVLDEAAELLGRCATRRIIVLSKTNCIHLLKQGSIPIADLESDCSLANNQWWIDKATSRQSILGAMIAVFMVESSNHQNHTIYLSCNFHEDMLILLTERRIADAWLRLIQTNQ